MSKPSKMVRFQSGGAGAAAVAAAMTDKKRLLDLEIIVSKISLARGKTHDTRSRTKMFIEGDILDFLADIVQNYNVEIGGFLDFNMESKFERNVNTIGLSSMVAMAEDEQADFEIMYHTNTSTSIRNGEVNLVIPSVIDIIAALKRVARGFSQVDVVFSPDAVYVIYLDASLPLPFIANSGHAAHWTSILQGMQDKYKPFHSELDALEYFEDLAKIGVFILRYASGAPLNRVDIRANWPKKIPVFANLFEPLLPQIIASAKHIAAK